MGNTLGKFLKGAADVAVPAALEEQRARIQQQRDARLQSFEAQERGLDRTARATESQADREARVAEAQADRALRGETAAAEAKYRQDALAADRERYGPDIELGKQRQGLIERLVATKDENEREAIAQQILAIEGKPETAADREEKAGRAAYYSGSGRQSYGGQGGRESMIFRAINDMQARRDEMMLEPGDPGYVTDETIAERAMVMVDAIVKRDPTLLGDTGAQGGEPAPKGGEAPPPAGTGGLVVGTVYKDSDGNRARYKGKDKSGQDIWEEL